MAATRSVEVEVTSATFNGTDAMDCVFTYRLINENTQAVLASKTVSLPLTNSGEMADPGEIMRSQVDAAGIWGQWLLAANKASQFVGTKQRTIIA
ncbi:MAG: hypothetical protein AB9873_08110 [Syntrophobacteraceae bacterium]